MSSDEFETLPSLDEVEKEIEDFDEECIKFAIMMDDPESVIDMLKSKNFDTERETGYMFVSLYYGKPNVTRAILSYLYARGMVPLNKYTESMMILLYRKRNFNSLLAVMKAFIPFVNRYGGDHRIFDILSKSSNENIAALAKKLRAIKPVS